MLLAHWHHVAAPGAHGALGAHLHGRELDVACCDGAPSWHWCVRSPHGIVLAEGDARTCEAAEEEAEAEALAVHPPSDVLLERLLS